MTVQDIINQVSAHGFQDQSSDPTIISWINNAYFSIVDYAIENANECDWLEQEANLVSSTGQEILTNTPSNIAKIIGLWGNAAGGVNSQVVYLPRDEFFERKYSGDVNNEVLAEVYTYFAQKVRVYPHPANSTATYRLIYIANPSPLTINSVIPMPERYHHLIITGALLNGYRQFDNAEQIQATEPLFKAGIEQMVKDLANKSYATSDLHGEPNSLGSMRQEVRAHGALDLGAKLIDSHINDAIYELSTEYPAPYLEAGPITLNTIAGNPLLEIPDDVSKVVGIYNNESKLGWYSQRIFADMQAENNVQGSPHTYTIWGYESPDDIPNNNQPGVGPSIMLYPTPNVSYSLNLWYIRTPNRLRSINDVADMPVEHRRIVILGALLRACLASTNEAFSGRYQAFKTEFEDRKAAMVKDLADKSYDPSDLHGAPNSLGSMRQEIRAHGALDLGAKLIDSHINDAIYEVSTIYPGAYLEAGPITLTTTPGQPLLEIPDDVSKVVGIYNKGSKLGRYSQQIFADRKAGSNVQGSPNTYTIWGYSSPDDIPNNNQPGVGPSIMLYPTPDRAYSLELWYIRTPKRLSSINDVVDMPVEHRRIVILGALLRSCLASTNESFSGEAFAGRYKAFKSEFEDRKAAMVRDVSKTHYDDPDYIIDVYDEDY
jgi:hypothetical protein